MHIPLVARGISNHGTGSDFSALQTNATSPYFKFPFSLHPLPETLRRGLWGPGLMGVASMLATTTLLAYLAWRLATWKKQHRSNLGHVSIGIGNQYDGKVLTGIITESISHPIHQSTDRRCCSSCLFSHLIVVAAPRRHIGADQDMLPTRRSAESGRPGFRHVRTFHRIPDVLDHS